jgi:hypothetical protein
MLSTQYKSGPLWDKHPELHKSCSHSCQPDPLLVAGCWVVPFQRHVKQLPEVLGIYMTTAASRIFSCSSSTYATSFTILAIVFVTAFTLLFVRLKHGQPLRTGIYQRTHLLTNNSLLQRTQSPWVVSSGTCSLPPPSLGSWPEKATLRRTRKTHRKTTMPPMREQL